MVDPRGSQVIVTHVQTLWWAADLLVEKLGAETLARLDIRAGEHLAAILATGFLGIPPVAIDAQGGLDLVFPPSATQAWQRLSGSTRPPVFEVKSLAGPFRQVEREIDRVSEKGASPRGMGVDVPILTASQLLDRSTPQLMRAMAQLQKKTAPEQSPNIFLVIHPFDGLAAEVIENLVISPALAPLDHIHGVESVWVLWAPEHLTVWFSARRRWVDLLFSAVGTERDEELVDLNERGVLQGVEQYFLDAIGHSGGSPFLFHLTASERGED